MFPLFKENVRIAFYSIKSQVLRTVLTVMIIAIGITALVGILSAVSALENTITVILPPWVQTPLIFSDTIHK